MKQNNNIEIEDVSLPKPKPRDSEPMMIINELSKIMVDEMRKANEEIGVPDGYRKILFELLRNNGCSQHDIALRTRLKSPTISLTLKKMEADGYITRRSSDDDMRVILVYLTEKGKNVHIKNREKIDKLDEIVLEGITVQEKEELIKVLIKMRTNICLATGRAAHFSDKEDM